MAKKFDAKTQKWVDVPETNTPKQTNTPTTQKSTPQPTSSPKINENAVTKPATQTQPVTTTKDDGKSKNANKDYTYKEFTYLTGECAVEPNSITLATQAGNTIELKNLGKYLSGMYFVTEVKIDISTSGTALTYSVLKNGFGKTLKPYVPTAETSKQSDTPLDVTTKVSAGDKVKFIEGADATYSNSHDGVKVPAWVKEKTHTVQKVTDDGQRALLKEISSWTYTKYLQKV